MCFMYVLYSIADCGKSWKWYYTPTNYHTLLVKDEVLTVDLCWFNVTKLHSSTYSGGQDLTNY